MLCILIRITSFFSKNISVYAIFNDQSFNDTLTNGLIEVILMSTLNIIL